MQIMKKTCLALILSIGTTMAVAQPRNQQAEEPTGYKDTYKGYFSVGVALNFRNIASPEQMAIVKKNFNSVTEIGRAHV